MARPVFYTPIKRSHLVAPFGVGSVLLARNGVGVVVCGLDEWLHERPADGRNGATWLERNWLPDSHLQHRLGVNRLIQPPPVADDPDDRNTWFVRVARFPRTEYCINPRCRRVTTRPPEGVSEGRCAACEPADGKRRGWPTQQVPLVFVCESGHLADIPWVEWVHDPDLQRRDDTGEPKPLTRPCTQPTLSYRVSTDITAPVVECESCSASIELGMLRYHRHSCTGQRSWLPGSAAESCDQVGQVVQRTDTALYYADVRSALHLPHGPHLDHRLTALLAEKVARLILDSYPGGERPADLDLQRLATLAGSRGISATPDDVLRHLEAAAAEPVDIADEEVRSREITALLDPALPTSSDAAFPPLVVVPQDVSRYGGPHLTPAAGRIGAISAVPRLAETRALVGFSRVKPRRVGLEEGFTQLWGRPMDPATERDWLVAHRVYGEGILLLLDPDAVGRWASAAATSTAWFKGGFELRESLYSARFVLAHSLAHALLREAASICGYPLPALRERIYDILDEGSTRRTGALIYTAEGDAYGTLGGLVELAEPDALEALVASAVEKARWCGADPVCMHPPERAQLQTTPGCCHHCLLLPETSCEAFNAGLDRAALVGGRDGVTGFFS